MEVYDTCKTKPSYEESLKIKEANKNYVDGLLKNSGTSTDMFVKKIGKEKNGRTLQKIRFLCRQSIRKILDYINPYKRYFWRKVPRKLSFRQK